MDRELLLELGCEELPASWLPGLTNQIGEVIIAELRARRLVAHDPAETLRPPRPPPDAPPRRASTSRRSNGSRPPKACTWRIAGGNADAPPLTCCPTY